MRFTFTLLHPEDSDHHTIYIHKIHTGCFHFCNISNIHKTENRNYNLKSSMCAFCIQTGTVYLDYVHMNSMLQFNYLNTSYLSFVI